MDMSCEQRIIQRQSISEQQIVSLRILGMNNNDLKAYIEETVDNNPLIEIIYPEDSHGDEVYITESEQRNHNYGRKNHFEDFMHDVEDAPTTSAFDYLFDQLDIKGIHKETLELLQTILRMIDENGYLRDTKEEISHITGKPVALVESCLEKIRKLDPPGVAAENLQQCLLLQLAAKGIKGHDIEQVVLFYLDDLAQHRYKKIAKELHITVERVKAITVEIKKLNPKPLNGIVGSGCQYIIPDLVFRQEESGWSIGMNDRWIGTVAVDREYDSLGKSDFESETSQFVLSNQKQARFLNHCIEKRRHTILRCAKYITEHQMEFFTANGNLNPLTIKQIAQALDIHASTVSRAINDKYIQTPRGTFLLTSLLSSGLNDAHSGSVSTDSIKNRIKELLTDEKRATALNDRVISELLAQEGVSISRRTIAKYRAELNIPNEWGRLST